MDSMRGGERERDRTNNVLLSRSRSEGGHCISSNDAWAEAGGDLLATEYTALSRVQYPEPREHRAPRRHLEHAHASCMAMHPKASCRPILSRASGRVRSSAAKVSSPSDSRLADCPVDRSREAEIRGSPHVPTRTVHTSLRVRSMPSSHGASRPTAPGGAIEGNKALSLRGNARSEFLSPRADPQFPAPAPTRESPVTKNPNADVRAEGSGFVTKFGARSRSPSDCTAKHFTLTIEALRPGETHLDSLGSGRKSSAAETLDTSLNSEIMDELHSEGGGTGFDKCASREGNLSSWVHAMDLLLQAKGAAHSNAAAASAASPLSPSAESAAMIAHQQRAPVRER